MKSASSYSKTHCALLCVFVCVFLCLCLSERQQILKGVQNIVVKAARRRSKALEADTLRLAPPPSSPLDLKKQKSNLSLSEVPPGGVPVRRSRQPSPELRHATSDDNLSSSTGAGDGPNLQVTWTRPQHRHVAIKTQTPRDMDFEARRKKRRSRSFEVTGQAVSVLPPNSRPDFQRFKDSLFVREGIMGQGSPRGASGLQVAPRTTSRPQPFSTDSTTS